MIDQQQAVSIPHHGYQRSRHHDNLPLHSSSREHSQMMFGGSHGDPAGAHRHARDPLLLVRHGDAPLLVNVAAAEVVDTQLGPDLSVLLVPGAGQGEDGGGQRGHGELVVVGEVEGVMDRDVVELHVNTSLRLALVTLHHSNTVVNQKSKKRKRSIF